MSLYVGIIGKNVDELNILFWGGGYCTCVRNKVFGDLNKNYSTQSTQLFIVPTLFLARLEENLTVFSIFFSRPIWRSGQTVSFLDLIFFICLHV
jgi:hypothetical protein